MSDIREWLEQLGLTEHTEVFEAEKVTLATLPELTDSELKELGLPLGHRKALLKAVRESPPHPGPSSTSAEIAPPSAERRQITVMFCDLVGSTALSEKLDPEDLRGLMQQYQQTCGAVITRYEGHVAQYLGDGLMIYFGWPRAHEDDAERAARAAFDIVSAIKTIEAAEPLRVRIGIATGPVVVGATGAGDASVPKLAVGETPNLAARLQGLAGADEIVIASTTQRLIGGVFELDDLGEHTLKGVVEGVQVYRVVSQSAVAGRFEASHATGVTPLISRVEEIDLLLKRWDQAKDGEGHVVLLSGEPGIGKSRITQAMTERIAAEPHVRLDYQCSPYHSSSALFPVIEQFERVAGIARDDGTDAKLDKMERALKQGTSLLPEAAPLFAAMLSLPAERYPPLKLSPERQRQKTVEALVDQLVVLSQTQPVLMIFEDVHWIDPTTLETLNAMVDRIQSIPVLLVITFRPEFEPPWRGHGHLTTLTLSRLSKRDCKSMVERMTGGKQLPAEVLDQIVVKTDGVPLFIEELTKTVLEAGFLKKAGDRYELDGPLPALGIPSTLQDSLMARLDRLAPVKEVAQVGACIGREFPYELLAAVSSLRGDELANALTELIDSELVFGRGAAPNAIYTFKHALVRDAAYMSLLKSRKREIHARIARTLEESFPDRVETDPELIAHHCTEAELSELAVSYWHKAGERAAARFSHEEAIKHYTHGLEIVQALPESEKRAECEYDLLTGIVASLRVLGRFDRALEALETAARIAACRDNPRERAEVHYLRGNMYFMQGKFEACLQEHETALQFAEQSGSVEFQARAYSGLGDAKYLRGQMISAFRYFDRTVKLAEENGFAEIEASNLHMRGMCRYYQNQISTSIDDLRRGSEATSKLSQFRSEVSARLSAATPLIELGDLEGVKETCRAGIDLAKRLGALQFQPFGEIFLSMAFAAEGDRSAAIAAARRASTIALESGRNFNGAWALGNLAVMTDDESERVNALRRGEEIVHAGSVGHAVLWFYRNAIEACINHSLWEDLERYAEALADYTKTEPLAWSDFFIARGRALAAWGSGRHDDAVRSELVRLRDDAQTCGHYASIHALDKALAADEATPLS